ncbi:MAG: choice-of-anchor P family protein [Panacagrimonas sp.]
MSAQATPVNSGVCDKRSTTPGVDLMLVIDRSGSMGNGIEQLGVPPPGKLTRLQGTKIVSDGLIDRMAAVDRVGLVSYSNSTTLNQALTFDKEATSAAVNALVTEDDTFAEPAIRLATQELLTRGRAGVRKIMIHLSDGFSRPDPIAAAADAKAAGIEIYAVAIRDPRPEQSTGVEQLRQQATDAAHFFLVQTEADLFFAFDIIGDRVQTGQLDLRSHAFGVKGTGNVLSLLNVTANVNDMRYKYDESLDPPLRSVGGTRNTVATAVNAGLAGGTMAFRANVITSTAVGSIDGTAKTARTNATSKITGMNLRLMGAPVLVADVIESRTLVTTTGTSFASSGSSLTANLRVAGVPLSVTIAPNTTLPLPLLGKIVLNEQKPGKSTLSASRTVNFAHLYLTGALIKGELILAHAFSGASCEEGVPMFPAAEL